MAQEEPNFSRSRRKKGRNRSNRILNLLIGLVVLLIIIVATTIFLQGEEDHAGDDVVERTDNEGAVNTEDNSTSEMDEGTLGGNSGLEDDANGNNEERENDYEERMDEQHMEEEHSDSPGRVILPSEDEVIAETIIDPSWQPIGTTQTGEHTSLYDGNSVDWEEKKKALAYATGLPYESMIFWKIKNGGGPQKSIGIVSSKDSEEKYRVYLEWVDGKGWKPVKMDVLDNIGF